MLSAHDEGISASHKTIMSGLVKDYVLVRLFIDFVCTLKSGIDKGSPNNAFLTQVSHEDHHYVTEINKLEVFSLYCSSVCIATI